MELLHEVYFVHKFTNLSADAIDKRTYDFHYMQNYSTICIFDENSSDGCLQHIRFSRDLATTKHDLSFSHGSAKVYLDFKEAIIQCGCNDS
jgi:hypothetical protein